MLEALKQAKKAKDNNEVPIGCVIVRNSDNKIIARAYNKRHTTKDATAHAELLAIKKACKVVGDWRLTGCTLYVTLEPCPMCAGAILNARIDKVVYGASDYKSGFFGGINDISNSGILNHNLEIVSKVCEDKCEKLLQDFFRERR